jgi:hypothetical protein
MIRLLTLFLIAVIIMNCSNEECNGFRKNCSDFKNYYEKYKLPIDTLIQNIKNTHLDCNECKKICFEAPISLKKEEEKIIWLRVEKPRKGGICRIPVMVNSDNINYETGSRIIYDWIDKNNTNEYFTYHEQAGFVAGVENIFFIERKVITRDSFRVKVELAIKMNL